MRAGAVLGEMALFTGAPRSAAAVARKDCILYRLNVDCYNDMKREQPAETGQFCAFVVRLMSDRLARANREIVALTR